MAEPLPSSARVPWRDAHDGSDTTASVSDQAPSGPAPGGDQYGDAPDRQERGLSKAILVGYDPKTDDRAPVEFGVAAARFTGAPLIVASVTSGPAETADEDLAASAAPALDELEREVQNEGVELECRELTGPSAARALHEEAEATDAGLLVVGSTRRGAVGRVFPGSTADRLMHGAPCPIAVVPRDWNVGAGPRTIGVAYVDTEEAREALRGAYSLARRAEATLRVLTVVRTGLGMVGETEASVAGQRGTDLEDVEGGYRVLAEQRARADVSELDGDVRVEIDALVDDPADTLIRISENLDLLVCGSRGYGPLRAVLLGGVSRRVAAEAHCPVIVLPRGVKGSLESLYAARASA